MDEKWLARFREMAQQWAMHSSCLRRKVGAVLVEPRYKAVLQVAYTGTPQGWPSCNAGGCQVCSSDPPASAKLDCNCIHAEMNALLLAGRRGIAFEGTLMIITEEPCPACQKHMTQGGVTWTT